MELLGSLSVWVDEYETCYYCTEPLVEEVEDGSAGHAFIYQNGKLKMAHRECLFRAQR